MEKLQKESAVMHSSCIKYAIVQITKTCIAVWDKQHSGMTMITSALHRWLLCHPFELFNICLGDYCHSWRLFMCWKNPCTVCLTVPVLKSIGWISCILLKILWMPLFLVKEWTNNKKPKHHLIHLLREVGNLCLFTVYIRIHKLWVFVCITSKQLYAKDSS